LPIVGDSFYGGSPLWLSRLKRDYRLKPDRTERPLIDGVALHAEQLSLPHPVGGAALTITAPWPKDLIVAAKYLRRYPLPQAEPLGRWCSTQAADGTRPEPSPGQWKREG
jgi:hypothetical protein